MSCSVGVHWSPPPRRGSGSVGGFFWRFPGVVLPVCRSKSQADCREAPWCLACCFFSCIFFLHGTEACVWCGFLVLFPSTPSARGDAANDHPAARHNRTWCVTDVLHGAECTTSLPPAQGGTWVRPPFPSSSNVLASDARARDEAVLTYFDVYRYDYGEVHVCV